MIPKPNIIYIPAHHTNTWSRLGQRIEYIVIHYVGAVSTAKNNAEYLHRDAKLGWSAHYFTDEFSTYQSVPLELSAGHCGVDYSGGKAPLWGKCRCKNSIGIEMCVKKDKYGRWYFEKETIENTVKLVRWLMQEYNIDIEHVVRHYDVCWKTCPEPFVRDPSAWENFKSRLTKEEYDMISDKQMKELEAYIDKAVDSKVNGSVYKEVKNVPKTWREKIQKIVDLGAIDGGTPASVNPNDVNLSRIEARVLTIVIRIIDAVFPGAIDTVIELNKNA